MLQLHNDMFIKDVTGYDRLKLVTFMPPNEILQSAPLVTGRS